MKLWTDSQSQLAESYSLLVVQPHRCVSFSLVLVNKATQKRCSLGELCWRFQARCCIIMVWNSLTCSVFAVPVGWFEQGPTLACPFVPATTLGCNSKRLARHSSSGHRWELLHTPCLVCTAVS